MGFFSGRVAFLRCRVNGPSPRMFGPKHLERLQAFAVGKQRIAASDGVEAGWTAGDHILDASFELEKNVVNDALHFCLRVDSQKIPSDLMHAYAAIELKALAETNPSGVPSAGQRKEARQRARERLEEEAADGRFLRRKAHPIIWDAPSNELLVGATSAAVVDRVRTLFEQTFGHGFEKLGAGRQMLRFAEVRRQTRGVDDAGPSPFAPGGAAGPVAWAPDEASRDFLGNEYLLWLWNMLDSESDAITLGDGSEASVLLTRTLVLECPRGQTGRQSIASDAPTRLPEARRAIQSGKLPRKVGLIVARHDQQYELTLQAETMAVSGAHLPPPEADDERARLEERVTQLRHLLETLDLMYDAFAQKRASDAWPKELARMQKWLRRDDPRRMSAMG
jgi:hypothetical protein